MPDTPAMPPPTDSPRIAQIHEMPAPQLPSMMDQLLVPVPKRETTGLPAGESRGFTYDDHLALSQQVISANPFTDQNVFWGPTKTVDRYVNGFGSSGYIGHGMGGGTVSEEWNAINQTWGTKAINGVGKFVGTAATEIISGTAGLLNGLTAMTASLWKNGQFDFGNFQASKFYNNITNNAMEDFRGWMENIMPHYYTQEEATADFSTVGGAAKGIFTANFLFDKFIKNAGFAVGAIVTGGIYGGAIGSLARSALGANVASKVNMIMRTDRGIIAAERVERELAAMSRSATEVERASKVLEIISEEAKLAKTATNIGRPIRTADEIAKLGKESAILMDRANKTRTALKNGLTSLLASVGEANIESVGGYRKSVEDLIVRFTEDNGRIPTLEEKAEIENIAGRANNYRWAMNVVALTISNHIQLPKFLKSYKSEKALYTQAVDEAAVLSKETGEMIKGKMAAGVGDVYGPLASAAKKKGVAAIAGTLGRGSWAMLKAGAPETLEEMSQYAFEVTADDYARMKYDGKSANIYDSLLTKGMPALRSSEGIQSGILGLLTGGVMDRFKMKDSPAKLQKDATEKAIKSFNEKPVTEMLKEGYSPYLKAITESAVADLAISADMDAAKVKGDVFTLMTKHAQGFFNWAAPRLLYGRKDLAEAELKQYHSNAGMPIEEVRKALQLPETATAAEVDEMVDQRLADLDSMENIRLFVNAKNEYNHKTGNYKYNDKSLTAMIYSMSMVANLDRRLGKMREQLATAGLDLSDMLDVSEKEGLDLDEIRNKKSKELLAIIRKDPMKGTDGNGLELIQKLHDIEKIQNMREQFVMDYMRNARAKELRPEGVKGMNTASTVEDLMDYEEAFMDTLTFNELEKTTVARDNANKLVNTLQSIGLKDMAGVAAAEKELKTLAATPGNFIYSDDMHALNATIESMRRDLREAHADIPAVVGEYGEEPTPTSSRDMDEKDIDLFEAADTATDEQKAKIETFKEQFRALNNLQSLAKTLSTNEPTTPTNSKIKRDFADGFMAKHDTIGESIEQNPLYADVEEVEQHYNTMVWMKEVYPKRTALLSTKPFGNFMDTLDANIAEAKEWLALAKKNRDDLARADREFAINQVVAQWNTLGIILNPNKEITPEEQADIDTANLKITGIQEQADVAKTAVETAITENREVVVADVPEFTPEQITELNEIIKKARESVVIPPAAAAAVAPVITPAKAEALVAEAKALEEEGEKLMQKGVDDTTPRRRGLIDEGKTPDEASEITKQEWLLTPGGKRFTEIEERLKAIEAEVTKEETTEEEEEKPEAAAPEVPTATPADIARVANRFITNAYGDLIGKVIEEMPGEEIGHLEEDPVFKALAALVGSDNIKQAAQLTRNAIRANKADYRKYLLGIMEQVRRLPDSEARNTFHKELTRRSTTGTIVLKELAPVFASADPVPGFIHAPINSAFSQKDLTQYYNDIIENISSSYPVLFRELFDKDPNNPYGRFLTFGDLMKFLQELQKDSDAGAMPYIHANNPHKEIVRAVGSVITSVSSNSLLHLIDSTVSLTDVYNGLRHSITEANAVSKEVPSERQLMSILELVASHYDRYAAPYREFGNTTFLNGRVGSGKTTVVLKTALDIIAKLSGGDIKDKVLLVGDTERTGRNFENALDVNQSSGKGVGIDELLEMLRDNKIPEGVVSIAIDEAARATSRIKYGSKNAKLKDEESLKAALETAMTENPEFRTFAATLAGIELDNATDEALSKLYFAFKEDNINEDFTDLIESILDGGVASELAAFNKRNERQISLILAGDTAQIQDSSAIKDSLLAIDKNLKTVTPLATSFRSKVSAINTLQAIFENADITNMRTNKFKFTANIQEPWNKVASATTGVLYGVSGSRPNTDAAAREAQLLATLEARIGIKNGDKPITKAVLVNEGQEKIWREKLDKFDPTGEIEVVSYYNAQGHTYDEVYINFTVDTKDNKVSSDYEFNTAMYTSARGRNFVYLALLNVETVLDSSLAERVVSGSGSLKDSADRQQAAVTSTYEYLKGIAAPTIEMPEIVTAAAVVPTGGVPPEEGGPPEEKKEDGGDVPSDEAEVGKTDEIISDEVQDGAEIDQAKQDEEGVLYNPDNSDGDVDEKIESALATEEHKETFVPKQEVLPPPPDSTSSSGGNGISIIENKSAPDSIRMYLEYPEHSSLDSRNAVYQMDGEGKILMEPILDKNKDPILGKDKKPLMRKKLSTLSVGEKVIIAYVRSKNRDGTNEYRYEVLRLAVPNWQGDEYDDGRLYQRVAVMSDAQVEEMRKFIPAFDAHDKKMKENLDDVPNSKMFDMKDYDRTQLLSNPTFGSNTLIVFDKVLDVPDFMQPTTTAVRELNFNYKKIDTVDEPMETDISDLPPKDKTKGTLKTAYNSFLKKYYDGMFHDPDNNAPSRLKTSYKDFVKDAHIKIETMNNHLMKKYVYTSEDKAAGLDMTSKPFTTGNSPLEVGKTYIVIKYGRQKEMFIEMEPAPLNFNNTHTLHNNLYIAPMRKFMGATRDLSKALTEYITSPKGMNWEPDKFATFWKECTKYTRNLSTKQVIEMYSDNPSGFDTSSYLFNQLAHSLINMSFKEDMIVPLDEEGKPKKKALPPPEMKKFIEQFHESVVKTRDDQRLSELARKLFGTIKEEHDFIDKASKKPMKFKYATGTEINKLKTGQLTRDDYNASAYYRRAQVAWMNIAQSNVKIQVPGEKRERFIGNFQKRTGRRSGREYTIMQAKDMLKRNYAKFGSGEEGKYDALFYKYAYDYYTDKSRKMRAVHMEPFQFKKQLDYMVKSDKKITLPDGYKSLEEVYKDATADGAMKGEASRFVKMLTEKMLAKFDFSELGLTEYEKLFGDEAKNESGTSIAGMRINIPSSLTLTKNEHWNQPASKSSKNLYMQVSPHQRASQMLTSRIDPKNPVTPTAVQLEFGDGVVIGEEYKKKKPKKKEEKKEEKPVVPEKPKRARADIQAELDALKKEKAGHMQEIDEVLPHFVDEAGQAQAEDAINQEYDPRIAVLEAELAATPEEETEEETPEEVPEEVPFEEVEAEAEIVVEPIVGDEFVFDDGTEYTVRGFTQKGNVQYMSSTGKRGSWPRKTFDSYIKEGKLKRKEVTAESIRVMSSSEIKKEENEKLSKYLIDQEAINNVERKNIMTDITADPEQIDYARELIKDPGFIKAVKALYKDPKLKEKGTLDEFVEQIAHAAVGLNKDTSKGFNVISHIDDETGEPC